MDRLADKLATPCIWNVSNGTVEHVFGRQAIPMVWNFAEAHPFSASTGNWTSHINWVAKSLLLLPAGVPGRASQGEARHMNPERPVLLSTDPPYYDNIGYADISDFFYVWQRRMLRDIYPELFATLLTPKGAELIAAPHRHEGDREDAKAFFEEGMRATFKQLREQVVDDYPVSIYYAYKQQDSGTDPGRPSSGWETMLKSLIDAGFQIVGTWPLRTERKGRMNQIGSNALASSVVLVCRPLPADAPVGELRAFRQALRRELPPALRELQKANIAATDRAQAAIGPGMALYSRYRQVLNVAGEALTVRRALGLINQAVDAFDAEQDGERDAETRFAVAWFEEHAFDAGPFGAADTLARARNTSVDSVAHAGLVQAGGGEVRLLAWGEYDAGAREPQLATVWGATHHLVERLKTKGEEPAADLLRDLPGEIRERVRDLVYHLHRICDTRGRATIALDYRDLNGSWPELQRLAASQDPQQIDLDM